MLKFAHFVTDEKFIPDSIKCFETAGLTDNTYYFVRVNNKNVCFLDINKVNFISIEEAKKIIRSNQYDVVCLHNLYSLPIKFISCIHPSVKVIWYAWGFDLYSNPAPTGPLLHIGEKFMPITKSFKPKEFIFNTILKTTKHIVKNVLKFSSSVHSSDVYAAIHRVDYFAGVFENEYEMMMEEQSCFKAKKIVQNYIHPEEFQLNDINAPVKLTGHNILLGNSASSHNNHVDIMLMIKDYIPNGVDIISPLSYQIVQSYQEKVMAAGAELFGDRFKPLKGYLPFDEYNKIMNSCDTIVLGQKQQAATCNCLTAMWNGIRLFMPRDSMNYKYYSQLGLKIFSIEDDFPDNPRLSNEDIMNNRRIIENYYSYRAWVRDLQNSLTILMQQ